MPMNVNIPMIDEKKRNEILLLILCLFIGFTLRFYAFDQKSLWIDEIYTYEDSRDDFNHQLKFYAENPTFLHPPLFYILTHLFYPFPRPERDLRIIPLIFGILSIPMVYFLSRLYSPHIALPCTLSLTFMAYHISLSQEGRSYSLLLFLGMAGLYFFTKHLITLKKGYLIPAALLFAISFYTSYSSILFIAFSQALWFYQTRKDGKPSRLSSFLTLNGLLLLLCLPWIIFLSIDFKGQAFMDPLHTESPGSFGYILYGIFHDWVPHLPLIIISVLLLILFPLFSNTRKNAIILLIIFILPIAGLYVFCTLFDITHFVTSRYFINLLPLFLISLYLSLDAVEMRFDQLKKFIRLKYLFTILFIASNLVILPLYYRSEKQDFRGLTTYLKGHLREGDKLFVGNVFYNVGLLHYFGIYPTTRHHIISFRKISEEEKEFVVPLTYRNKTFSIFNSEHCCSQYVTDGSRLWIIVSKSTAKSFKNGSPAVLKGYFDGSFLNFNRFPFDASLCLFLWDPKSPQEKGMVMSIE
jgi:4-amino-4-deoxy-L-arabinose transferase-like glycosyltransferase